MPSSSTVSSTPIRIPYQEANGAYNWPVVRGSGVENVTGFSVGQLLATNTAALAVTAPAANRIQIIPATNQNVAGVPVSGFIDAVGPGLLIAIDIVGVGNMPPDDLMVGSIWNNPSNTALLAFTRTTDPEQPATLTNAAVAAPARGNRVLLSTNNVPEMAALLLRSENEDQLNIYDLSAGADTNLVLSAVGLPSSSDYTFGFFDGGPLSHFLFYQPGNTNLIVQPVEEPVSGMFQFGRRSHLFWAQPSTK